MKNLLAILLLTSLIIGCKKNNNNSPTPTPAPQNNTNSQPSLNAQEQSLLGLWLLDSTVVYVNSVRSHSIANTGTVNCRVEFFSTQYSTSTYKNVIVGHTCQLSNSYWEAPNTGYVLIGGIIYSISTLNSTKLVYTTSYQSGEFKYYFHK